MMAARRDRAHRPDLQEETACALCERRAYRTVGLRDRRGRPLRTVMCDVCGLVWTNPRPTLEDVDRYYAHEYRADYARHRDPTARAILRGLLGAEERRRALAGLLRPGARALDVGCGLGAFVYLLRQQGVDAAGIEPGEAYAEFSRRVLGIPIETTTVAAAAVAPDSLDLVTMFHVLEHAADPRGTLTAIRGWLSPGGGRLVVEVPNLDSTVQAPRHRFHYAHLHAFNAATLGALGESAALTVVRASTSADGGNLTCEFSRAGGEARTVVALPENVARTRELLRRHTSLRHYAGLVPYRRVVTRLRRRLAENRLLRTYPTVEALLRHLAEAGVPRLD
jgi:2-polyprenyl-3-methyl-5-hydroxy-6-metoxy-1,4-benzoquinol methylase